MQIRDDLEFYVQRERQERSLADRTAHPEGRRAHLEMAKRYARLIADAETRPTLHMRMPG